jgi:phosphotransferase family enzyme
MSRGWVSVPTKKALERGLSAVLGNGGSNDTIRIAKRLANDAACNYASEIVECVRPDGTPVRVLMKYGKSAGCEHGQRLGPDYEALVYREVLQPLSMTSPRCYGAYTEQRARETWLVVEHINDAMHVGKSWINSKGMSAAAGWIGRFHALNRTRAARLARILNCYDARYCRLWARRTLRFEGGSRLPWLRPLVARFEEAIDVLMTAPQTIIHGDFYCDNALYRRGTIYAIDWELAGIGAGEIDLACLTMSWPDEMTRPWVRSYCEARWPRGAPRAFGQRFNAAQLYVLFRLLGEGPGWPDQDKRDWRLDLLRAAGERMGLI